MADILATFAELLLETFFFFTSILCPHGLTASRCGDVAVYVFDINQSSLPTPFYSVLVAVSVFTALSTVFHFIDYFNNFQLSHSVLPVLFSALLVLSTIYLFTKVPLSPDIILCG